MYFEKLNEKEMNDDSIHRNEIDKHSKDDDSLLSTPSMFYMYLLTFLSCIGGFLFGYDTGVISGALVLLKDEFNLSDIEQELIVGLAVAGALVSSIFAGYLTDRYGRRPVILVSSALFTIGSIMLACAQDLATLLIGRFIVGLGVGTASSIFPIYVSESAPAHMRGTLVTTINVAITFGQFFSSIVDAAFVSVPHGWRYMLGLGSIPSFIQFIGFFFYMPESPRWLIEHKHVDKATLALQRLRDQHDVCHEVQGILNLISSETNNGHHMTFSHIMISLREVSVTRALILGCALQAAQQLCGINTIMYYTATILGFAGFASNLEILLWLTAVASCCNFLGSCGSLYAVDRYGRRFLTLSSLAGVSICLGLLSLCFYFAEIKSSSSHDSNLVGSCSQYQYCFDCIQDDGCGWCESLTNIDNQNQGTGCIPKDDDDNPVDSTQCYNHNHNFYPSSCPGNSQTYGYMIFMSLCCYLLIFSFGMGSMPWTITSEIFPTNVRGVCNSITTTMNWTTNLIVSLTFLTIANACSKQGAFAIYAGIAILFFVFLYMYLPETKDLPLEGISALFSDRKWGRYYRMRVMSSSFNQDHDGEKKISNMMPYVIEDHDEDSMNDARSMHSLLLSPNT